MKKTFYTEAAYLTGIASLALGTAFMEAADLGLSMVVAPAYLIHLKLSQTFSFFTFGMAEYLFQACLLVLLTLVLRKFRLSYLFSFVTAVFYGLLLDLFLLLVGFLPIAGMAARLGFFLLGFGLCALGVSMMFHTYIAPEVYELFVKELSAKRGWEISRVKTVYDCVSCALAIIMSFAFFGFGHFEGVKAGTIACALLNGWVIGRISRALDRRFDFRDATQARRFFA